MGLIKKRLKVTVTFTEELLGTASNNPDIHEEFIASKAPDAQSREEEVEAIGVDAVVEKGKTVFPRNADGKPIMWDYQVKGYMKDTCKALKATPGTLSSGKDCRAYKQLIDKRIFVFPREIVLDALVASRIIIDDSLMRVPQCIDSVVPEPAGTRCYVDVTIGES